MGTSKAARAITGCRTQPKPATYSRPTPMNDSTPAWAMAVWLDSISSFSMTGRPVKPIQASGCRFFASLTICRNSLRPSEYSAKLPLFSFLTRYSASNPTWPSLSNL